MNAFDLTPLFRTSVGFDRMSRLMDTARQLDDGATRYPPYNIAKVDENQYRITLAVAGFSEDELSIETHEQRLKVTGHKAELEDGVEYLHRGIAGRAFERTFQLADHVRVTDANLVNGLLHIELERVVPEALKPRTVAIGSGVRKQLDAVAAK